MAESQDLVCTGCQKTLRIPAKFWGKKVRCPQCRQVLTVPAEVALATQAAPQRVGRSSTVAGVKRASPASAKLPPSPPVGALDDVEFIDDVEDPYAEDPYADVPDQYEFDSAPRPKARSKPKKRKKKPKTARGGGAFRMERGMLGAGVLGGIGLMALAVIWFVGGLMGGYIFYYPPVMFVIGLFAMIKGFVGSD